MLILNWVYHANVSEYRNYTLILHTCLEILELTQIADFEIPISGNSKVNCESKVILVQNYLHSPMFRNAYRKNNYREGGGQNVC